MASPQFKKSRLNVIEESPRAPTASMTRPRTSSVKNMREGR